jgi:hypothetical protein
MMPCKNILYFIFNLFEGVDVKNYHNQRLLIVWAFASIFICNFFSDIQALMVCRNEIRIESIQQIIENKN